MPSALTFPWPPWSADAAPGVFVRPEATPAPAEVCLDVVAFVGVARRGEQGVARDVRSAEELVTFFGEPVSGGALHASVRLFFENGGRRAVVVNAAPNRPPDAEGDDPRPLDATTRQDLFDALSALDAWDDRHPTEPVATICLPELLLAPQPPALVEPARSPTPGTRFGPDLPAAPTPAVRAAPLPLPSLRRALATDDVDDLDRLGDALERCARADRVLLLAGAPELLGLAAGASASHLVLVWPRARVASPEDPAAAPRAVDPSGAVAGLVARREREAGVAASLVGHPLLGVNGLELAELPALDRVCTLLPGPRGPGLGAAWLAGGEGGAETWPARRLLQHLRRQTARDLAWAVFEPIDGRLAARAERIVARRLERLAAGGALEPGAWRLRVDADPDRGALGIALELQLPRTTRWIALRLLVAEGQLGTEASDA